MHYSKKKIGAIDHCGATVYKTADENEGIRHIQNNTALKYTKN